MQSARPETEASRSRPSVKSIHCPGPSSGISARRTPNSSDCDRWNGIKRRSRSRATASSPIPVTSTSIIAPWHDDARRSRARGNTGRFKARLTPDPRQFTARKGERPRVNAAFLTDMTPLAKCPFIRDILPGFETRITAEFPPFTRPIRFHSSSDCAERRTSAGSSISEGGGAESSRWTDLTRCKQTQPYRRQITPTKLL